MAPIFKTLACCCCVATTALAEDWTEFRGPTGQGISTEQNLPTEWSTNSNVIWKQPLPGLGWSSPAIKANRIYVTTGIPSTAAGTNELGPSLQVLCLDAATGKTLWTTEVFKPIETQAKPLQQKNSHASPTPLLEGDRIYAHFGHNGIACLDTTGKILWRNTELGYSPMHGNGGSPIIVDDKLIYNADGMTNPAIIALNKNTGKLLWKTIRVSDAKNKFSFATPLLITVDGKKQVITPGSGVVQALDPADGHEIWRVNCGNAFSVIPRPVFGHGLVFIAPGANNEIMAIRPNGQGDVTATHVAWSVKKGAPSTPSLLLVGTELYAVSDSGTASCIDALTGKVHWQERVPGNYSASPLYADGRIYLQNEKGTGVVLKPGTNYLSLATNTLSERTLASYAVADHSLFIRTADNLYRIGQNASK